MSSKSVGRQTTSKTVKKAKGSNAVDMEDTSSDEENDDIEKVEELYLKNLKTNKGGKKVNHIFANQW